MTGRTDAPIYLHCFDKTKKENLWYMIEEKENYHEHEEYITTNEKIISNMKLTDEGWIKTIHESETDSIRALRLPAFSYPRVSRGCLAVSNSHIYVLDDMEKLIFYDHSSPNNNTWEEGPYSRDENFTLLNNGSIYSRTVGSYRSSSPGRLLEPKPHLICSDWSRFPEIQLDEIKNTFFDFVQLLAITDTKIYWIFDVDVDVDDVDVDDVDVDVDVHVYKSRYVIYFDLQKREWEIFDGKSFRGRWSQGVVLYDNFLFLCGKPDYHDDEEGSLFVYDLKQHQWLPHYVPFLDEFEEFLPNCSNKYGKGPNLLKVCDNKFAVVWESHKQPFKYGKEVKNETQVCWSKFIIHKDFSSSNNPFWYRFRAELYSHGVCDIMGSMLNIAAEQTLNNSQFSAIPKLNGTNHKSWIESLMINLARMEIDLALREDPTPKPAATVAEVNFYREWKYSNKCCLKIISYHMEDSIRDSIPKTGCAKSFLKSINKKYRNLSKNEKNEFLSTLHSIIYDGKSGIREHIDKVVGCYRKMKVMGIKLDDEYIVWMIMYNLPSQFDSIRSRYNAQKEDWTIKEMTTILVKEEVDMYMAMARKRWLG